MKRRGPGTCMAPSPPRTVTVAPSGHLTGTRFFPDGRLNFAENLLGVADNRPALVFRGEDPEVAGARHTLTRRDLHHLVSRLQQAMLGLGVAPGDRVAAWMPNVPETCAVMLAAAEIRALASPSAWESARALVRTWQVALTGHAG